MIRITSKMKADKFQREVWYEYTINKIPTRYNKKEKINHLYDLVKDIRKNYNIPLDERRGYLKLIRKKLEEIK